eukprot:TRINITY_DN15843_c0_g2_i1.p1 TRINITY_DN15843_c0_g2~~TRINITY_DN15843_c0_g2_i1.p1  ORF type:complete len:318 (+),score=37.68 TRINITY_DN15843_c0_g2_i1:80-1033(+)
MVFVPIKLTLLTLPPLLLAFELPSSDNNLPQLDTTSEEAIAVDSECSEEDDHCSLALRQLRVRTHKAQGLTSDSMLKNRSCSAHSGCEALAGDCCPTAAGEFLGCCDQKTPAAAAQPSPTASTQEAKTPAAAERLPNLKSTPATSPPAMPVLQHSAGHSHIMTLYHITNPEAGASILRSAFKAGHTGWCGGAIYFAPSPNECWHKAAPGMLSKGIFMIEAVVDVGRSKSMPAYCTSPSYCNLANIPWCGADTKNREAEFKAQGYDSITFNPGDGQEYLIWEPWRVKSMKQIPWPPGATPSPPPPPANPWGYYPPYYW